ncbi:recombination protein F [Pseudobythopirellula maris]|uniref:Recombination protein F n=1 Tax=Pseudobythopirellula maris TaxID=2527991 RepID=A0A5C5ZIW3_9BACT|nr:AAA family ATPase [Pseudobythopirellula maris]TWT87289.1 recombination protein F [Pseudobythopirellula maris]
MTARFLQRVSAVAERTPKFKAHPFDIPFVVGLELEFESPVTFFVGENGSGKSTLLEAIAALAELPASGGSRNEVDQAFAPEHQSKLAPALRPSFRERPRDGYFLRAEFLAHFASLLDQRNADPGFAGDAYGRYGGKSLHKQSHGEAFLSVLKERVKSGLFLFDEPEVALSPQRQLALLLLMHELVETGETQFIIATHSPILLTFPGATIVSFDVAALKKVSLEETSHYRLTKGILDNPAGYWRHLTNEGQ